MFTFDWSIERLGHSDHHIGAEYPEYVVEEETAKQNAPVRDFVELEELDAVDGERQAEDVVSNPMLDLDSCMFYLFKDRDD